MPSTKLSINQEDHAALLNLVQENVGMKKRILTSELLKAEYQREGRMEEWEQLERNYQILSRVLSKLRHPQLRSQFGAES